MEFVGRVAEQERLTRLLDQVRQTGAARMLALRGRRQIGKSRMLEHWLEHAGAPYVFFQATGETDGANEVAAFREGVERSGLPGAEVVAEAATTWQSAFSVLAASVGQAGTPCVVVLDEFPYLFKGDASIDGAFQLIWDKMLNGKAPVFLILVGSDLHMMELLGQYDRPLYGRVQEMVLEPLPPSQAARLTGLAGAAALDGYLITGGFPNLIECWQSGEDVWSFLGRLLDPNSPLIVNGERILTSEFPAGSHPSDVLLAIGDGQAQYTSIQQAAGVKDPTLQSALQVLASKGVIEIRRPLSTAGPGRNTRYEVVDPYLRFWLKFIRKALPEISRGRPDLPLQAIQSAWNDYRGRAVEPIVREAVARMLPDRARFDDARFVGSYWTRSNVPEVDLVGVENQRKPSRIEFIGSIKWRDSVAFDGHDFATLAAVKGDVPGTDPNTKLIAVSHAGFRTSAPDVALGADDLLAAY